MAYDVQKVYKKNKFFGHNSDYVGGFNFVMAQTFEFCQTILNGINIIN